MKIVSFLPAATEMLYALGLEDQLFGVSHECDFPSDAKKKAIVVRNAIDMAGFSQKEIDQCVSKTVQTGQSLYLVDEEGLKEIAPDLILTQDLCQVCAPSGNEITALFKQLPKTPETLYLTPTCLDDIFLNLQQIAAATGQEDNAKRQINKLKKRVDHIAQLTRTIKNRPRIVFMEWLSPPYCGGHWIGEMIEIAGGIDPLAQDGTHSQKVPWQRILEAAPEILILAPCGFNLSQVIAQAEQLTECPGWNQLPAVKNGQVYAVDANSYFARPGPRVVDGIELLAHLFHLEQFEWKGPKDAYSVWDG